MTMVFYLKMKILLLLWSMLLCALVQSERYYRKRQQVTANTTTFLKRAQMQVHRPLEKRILKPVANLQLGAIFMLLSDWKSDRGRKCYFNASMDALASKWRPDNKYPIILMNTNKWKWWDMCDIRRTWSTLDFRFVSIGDVFDYSPPIAEKYFEDAWNPLSNMNYKRMCHFFIKGFLQVPLLMDFKYLMRLDDDTCILDHINFDMFRYLDQKNIAYAYSAVWYDGAEVTRGLNQFVADYAAKNTLEWSNPVLRNATLKLHGYPQTVPAFNTNLEIINTVRYRDPEVMQFVNAVVESNNIFHRRWGDAPLRFPLAEMFWAEKEIVKLDSFDHQHSIWEVFRMSETTNKHPLQN